MAEGVLINLQLSTYALKL